MHSFLEGLTFVVATLVAALPWSSYNGYGNHGSLSLESLFWYRKSLQIWAGLCPSLNAVVPMHAVCQHSCVLDCFQIQSRLMSVRVT